MTDLPAPGPLPRAATGVPLLARLAMSPRFHALAERLPFLRGHARAEGRALFDIVSGFVQSQALLALVELQILERLAERSASTTELAIMAGVPEPRMAILLQSGAALRLLRRKGAVWQITPRGAAFLTVPGLQAMVRHHPVLYRDLSDPVAFFRGQTEPELAGFWPYVFGPMAQADAALFHRYSRLMADSQRLVAEDTLRLADLSDVKHLMDVGGGTGAFLRHVAADHPKLVLTLFDLPDVLSSADRFSQRLVLHPGSFRTDPLPQGADCISLIRVLYDHPDEVVIPLLAKIHAALPAGGKILVSEPMSGGETPDPATDVYFAVYTLAMRTGRTRSGAEIARLLQMAGFSAVSGPKTLRSFITSVVQARRD